VAQHLTDSGVNAQAIHGNKSQGQRERALAEFKADKVKVLVATDIAARGIDIDQVSHVVNFELPDVPESYVHRIGRTARAGNSGIAITLCSGEEKGLLRDIERLTRKSIPSEDRRADKSLNVDSEPLSTRADDRKAQNDRRGSRGGRGVSARPAAAPRSARPEGEGAERARPQSRSAPRGDRAARPTGDRPIEARPFAGRPDRHASADRPTADRAAGDRPQAARPSRGSAPRSGAGRTEGAARPERRDSRPSADRAERPVRSEGGRSTTYGQARSGGRTDGVASDARPRREPVRTGGPSRTSAASAVTPSSDGRSLPTWARRGNDAR
jgi:ATP-dependent RNA helicase RhlE